MENISESTAVTTSKPKVAIIGAGVLGLLWARHFSSFWDIQVYETRDGFGGVWNYTPVWEKNYGDLESNAFYKLYGCLGPSLYKHLSTIIPKFWMTFKDFDYSFKEERVITSEEFFEYITGYVNHFDLEKHIRFNTTVEKIKVCSDAEHPIMLQSIATDLSTNPDPTIEYFDYLAVCTGHFSVPLYPNFKGYETYDGDSFHIHELREIDPELVNGKNVLIVGLSVSALDVVTMIFKKTQTWENLKPQKVFITSKSILKLEKSDDYRDIIEDGRLVVKNGNVTEMMKDKQVVFGDGTQETIDTVIYCTGYKYWFPFFDSNDQLLDYNGSELDRGTQFGQLYKKIFLAKYPRIMFLGMTYRIFLSMTVFERQAMICSQFIKGEITLPCTREMLAEIEEETKRLKEEGENYFEFGKANCEFKYHEELSKMSNIPEETRYREFKPIKAIYCKTKSMGNELQSRNFDYEKMFEGMLFKQTSEYF